MYNEHDNYEQWMFMTVFMQPRWGRSFGGTISDVPYLIIMHSIYTIKESYYLTNLAKLFTKSGGPMQSLMPPSIH